MLLIPGSNLEPDIGDQFDSIWVRHGFNPASFQNQFGDKIS